jgi:hypothetical protein
MRDIEGLIIALTTYIPVTGVRADTLVSIKKLGANGLEETYKRDGRIAA